MKIKILEKTDKPLLYRQELKLEVEFDNEVPSRKFLVEQVAKAVKADKRFVIISSIGTKYGSKVADVVSYVYTDEKKMESFVRGYMKKRHEFAEEDKKEEAEAKSEEKKEEAKPEEKKEATAEEKKEATAEEKKEGE